MAALAVVLVAAIIWIDLTTNLWQNYVVISGLAGGLVTFVFTALVVDRFIARSAHERWEPVTRLALGDLRRRLQEPRAHDEVRRLPGEYDDSSSLSQLIELSERERDRLTDALARWSSFLSSSADVSEIMDAIALVAVHLDNIDHGARAMAVDATAEGAATLQGAIDEYHRAGDQLLAQIDAVLADYALRENAMPLSSAKRPGRAEAPL